MWLQLGNKSMLMSQKLGQRLADECQSPQQITVADDLKRNPRPSILEPMPHHGQGGMHGGSAPAAAAPAQQSASQPHVHSAPADAAPAPAPAVPGTGSPPSR
jgi:hypothetical protein